MDRREQILYVTLELAAEGGLGSVSMARIAEKIGIQKPSLYNHFKSRDEIISEMYRFFRDKAKQSSDSSEVDYSSLVKGKTAYEILSEAVMSYGSMVGDEALLAFYRVIYSERACDPAAAGIMADETRKMILATKNLFYAMQAHNKLHCGDIDTAAVSFAMTVHSLMDYKMDCTFSGKPYDESMTENYIKWFSDNFGGNSDEKNNDK